MMIRDSLEPPENPLLTFVENYIELGPEEKRKAFWRAISWQSRFKEVLRGDASFCRKHFARVLKEFGYPGNPQQDYIEFLLRRGAWKYMNPRRPPKLELYVLLALLLAGRSLSKNELTLFLNLPKRKITQAIHNLRRDALVRVSSTPRTPIRRNFWTLHNSTKLLLTELLNSGLFVKETWEVQVALHSKGVKPICPYTPDMRTTILKARLYIQQRDNLYNLPVTVGLEIGKDEIQILPNPNTETYQAS